MVTCLKIVVAGVELCDICEAHIPAMQRQWTLKDGKISFKPMDERSAGELPSKELIDNALTYAREIERIV